MEAYAERLSRERLDQLALEGRDQDHSSYGEVKKPYYDASHVIIGSGMGGGMVARQLMQSGHKVLLLEKGKLPYPTHCLNLSRRHFDPKTPSSPGRDNEVAFKEFKTPYKTRDECEGGSVFALGGRSLFWSLEAAKITQATATQNFPKEITNFLYGLNEHVPSLGRSDGEDESPKEKRNGYDQALKIMANSPPGDPSYPMDEVTAKEVIRDVESKLKTAIQDILRDKIVTVPNGAEFTNGANLYYFPQSAYSTVDYLLDRLYNSDNPEILMDAGVTKLVMKERKIEELHFENAKGEQYSMSVKNKKVVLCAGTVNTAAIALRSGLRDGSPLVGQGLTDHEIWMAKFWDSTAEESKRQAVELSCHVEVHGHLALLTICTHAEKFYTHGFAACTQNPAVNTTSQVNVLNVMLEFDAPLNEEGRVICGKDSTAPTLEINRKRLDTSKEFETELKNLVTRIRTEFAFPNRGNDMPILQPFGLVAHEAGTMRINTDEKRGVVDENLKVHGLDNLYVCDLSVFPLSPSANPSRTLTALATRLGNHLTTHV